MTNEYDRIPIAKEREGMPGAGPCRVLLPALFVCLVLPALILAQDEEKKNEEVFRKRIEGQFGQGGAEDLVERIRKGMQKIDENLLSASAKGVREEMKKNIRNLDALLKDTRDQSNEVIKDLDALIRSIKYQNCGSGASGSPKSPKDPSSGEQEENQPRSDQEDGELKNNPASSDQEKEAGAKKEPKDGAPDNAAPKQEGGEKPPSPDSEEADHPGLSGRWGVLPPKIQNDILNFNIENFPQKYRKWLEEYYRRINRRKAK